ncbi:zinc metalloprotease HtpX [Sedimenticola hydrogenitrophicus]|uniref:zinc metalloprotease HtpX n=1 Tax=Sedimenticola hydrogenitrophicus TaxID=2967975 RepID=UPI0023AFA704|nr:zinc metalloprotease HtpX [Sedimenticola hydrogenitrophicus]
MNQSLTAEHRLRNLLHTLLLIGGMALLLALISGVLFGKGVWPWVFVGVILAMSTLPDISPHWLLRLYHARRLHPQQAPDLTRLMEQIGHRAGVTPTPALYWIPSSAINAFSVGSRDEAAIALTDGLLQLLSPRELAGVLAHETSHIANHDMRLMNLADVISRLTHMLSLTGILLALISLPLVLLGMAPLPLLGLLLLIAAPTLSALLQLGLSRVREFQADLSAAHITGDPVGLASALGKIEYRQTSLWRRILLPGYRDPEPSLLRTHPETAERVWRLLELRDDPEMPNYPILPDDVRGGRLPGDFGRVRSPRHRLFFRIWR